MERYFVEGGRVKDMKSNEVHAVPVLIDSVLWNGKGNLEDVVAKNAPKGATGYACGPFRPSGDNESSAVGVLYFKKK